MTLAQFASPFSQQSPTMARLFCHECSYEGTDFSTSHEGFVCPRCGGSFCEEVSPRSSLEPNGGPHSGAAPPNRRAC